MSDDSTAVLKGFTDDELQLQVTRYTTIWGVGHPDLNFGVSGHPRHPQWLRAKSDSSDIIPVVVVVVHCVSKKNIPDVFSYNSRKH